MSLNVNDTNEIIRLSEAASASAQAPSEKKTEFLFEDTPQTDETQNETQAQAPAEAQKMEGDNGKLSDEALQKIYMYASSYASLYEDAHFKLNEKDMALEIRYDHGKKEIDVHFDESGEKLYTEFKNGNGDYNLSNGRFGKNRNEAVQTLIKNFMANGAKNAEQVDDKVVANYQGYQTYFVVQPDGSVHEHGIIGQKEDFIPTKNNPETKLEAKTPAEQYANTYQQIAGDDAQIVVVDNNNLVKLDEKGDVEVMITVDNNGKAKVIKYLPKNDTK